MIFTYLVFCYGSCAPSGIATQPWFETLLADYNAAYLRYMLPSYEHIQLPTYISTLNPTYLGEMSEFL